MTSNRDGGKGDKPRPIPDPQKYRDNWDTIFKKNQEKVKATIYGVEIKKTKEEWNKLFENEPK
jgi:hypothetical protein